MLRIKLGSSLEAAKNLVARFNGPVATIEAEYGSQVIQGEITLAHHVQGWETAPSLSENNLLEKAGIEIDPTMDYVLVSHIDLDTVTGIMALIGKYDVPQDVKEGINFVDCNGQHHLFSEKVSEGARRVILAYIGYSSINRAPFGQEDVTEYVHALMESFNTEANYEAGLKLVSDRTKEAEESLVIGLNGIAVLEQAADSKVFGLNSEYMLKGQEYNYIIVYSNKFKSVTVSSRLGAKDVLNMSLVMKDLFGPEAGGHAGIAGTPRGVEFTSQDAMKVFAHLNMLRPWDLDAVRS